MGGQPSPMGGPSSMGGQPSPMGGPSSMGGLPPKAGPPSMGGPPPMGGLPPKEGAESHSHEEGDSMFPHSPNPQLNAYHECVWDCVKKQSETSGLMKSYPLQGKL